MKLSLQKKLSEITGLAEPNIRKIINNFRCAGVPICSTTKGYYFSWEEDDIIATTKFLTNRVQTQLRAIDGLLRLINDEAI